MANKTHAVSVLCACVLLATSDTQTAYLCCKKKGQLREDVCVSLVANKTHALILAQLPFFFTTAFNVLSLALMPLSEHVLMYT